MSQEHQTSAGEARTAARTRVAFVLALLAALIVGARLAQIAWTTQWGMDADEAVHAVESLRLHDRLAAGEVGAFLHDTWFPERWAPPVDPHLRWYPFVHAWAVIPSFAVLGPTDFSARLPSILFLVATALVFFRLGARLAPRTAAASGLLASLLLLSSPNVLTFSAQSLIEPAALFFCSLALLAYLRSLELGHPTGRAVLAGLALGMAMLTKYDHGGLLALCLGLSEILHHRLRMDRVLRSGAGILFAVPLLMLVLWFAHPDKLAALTDSISHPFAGSRRLISLDFALTWFVEYGSSLAMGLIALAALVLAWRVRTPEVRAVWIWALVTVVFLGVRSRFHFRYNFVEGPVFLLLAAAVIPSWVESVSRALCRSNAAAARWCLVLTGCALTAMGAGTALDPTLVQGPLESVLGALHGLRADHFGMSLEPAAYVEHFTTQYRAAVVYLAGSAATMGFALALLGVGGLVLRGHASDQGYATHLVWTALAVALVPGVVRLQAHLRPMVEWELECHPELNEVHAFINGQFPTPATVLLGGGWDQLTNNGVRWYRLTRGDGDPRYAEARVVGDMIGSLVFPSEPRVRYWAGVLASAPAVELPDRVVLVEHGDGGFLYRARVGVEAAVYADLLEARAGYEQVDKKTFDALGVEVRVYRRAGRVGPPVDVEAVLAAHGIEPETTGNASREFVGEGGWSLRDESLRHFVRR